MLTRAKRSLQVFAEWWITSSEKRITLYDRSQKCGRGERKTDFYFSNIIASDELELLVRYYNSRLGGHVPNTDVRTRATNITIRSYRTYLISFVYFQDTNWYKRVRRSVGRLSFVKRPNRFFLIKNINRVSNKLSNFSLGLIRFPFHDKRRHIYREPIVDYVYGTLSGWTFENTRPLLTLKTSEREWVTKN